MCYNYSIETDNGNEEMINRDYAIVIADEALNFMANRAKISREEVVRLIDEKHESTCKYFANLVAIGYTELMKSNIGVTV